MPGAMITVDEARTRIFAALGRLPAEQVSLPQAAGRVLAEDIVSRVTKPPVAVSSMDGYAVRAADTRTVPAVLEIIGEAPAGHALDVSLDAGQAVRIFTGGKVPDGADCVVIQENTRRDGAEVTILSSSREGRHVRPAGLDFSRGEPGGLGGRRLGPREVGLAASMNCLWVKVTRRPRIAIMGTGDELVMPGEMPRADQIIGSNSLVLAALVAEAGGEAVNLGIAPDDEHAIRDVVRRSAHCDMLVVSGGMSVGEHDLVRKVMTDEGMALDFWKVAMRPGKPLAFGMLGALPVLGLPGNPVSTMVCGHLFLRPAIHRMLGRTDGGVGEDMAVAAAALAANDERQDYLRAKLSRDTRGILLAEPFPRQDSSMVSVLSRSSCLIVRPPHAPAAEAGERVRIIRLSSCDA